MNVCLVWLNTCAMRRQNREHYRRFLERNGHRVVSDPAESDLIVVWTCAFRGDVLENSLAQLEAYEREYDAEVAAVGCLPAIAPDAARKRFRGRLIPWSEETEALHELFRPERAAFQDEWPVFVEPAVCKDAAAYRRAHPDADVTFHDQFTKLLVSEGCPYACTYCTERLAFPPFRSFPPDRLAEALAAAIEETDNKDVILLSDCLGEYGRDIGESLPSLIRRLREVTRDGGFALNNYHPKNALEQLSDLLEFIRDGWIRHLNLPIQSASDSVLAAMNRGYVQTDLDRLFSALNDAGFRRFDTHVIVGFPGETEADFDRTVEWILRHRPQYVLLSRFLESPAAPAAALPNKVPPAAVDARVARAQQAFADAGILCNWEGSEMIKERLRRLQAAAQQQGPLKGERS